LGFCNLRQKSKRERERSKPLRQPSGEGRYGFCGRGFWNGDEKRWDFEWNAAKWRSWRMVRRIGL